VLAALPILATGEQVLAAGSAGAAAAQSASSGGAGAGATFLTGITAFYQTLITLLLGSVLSPIFGALVTVVGIWSGIRNAPTLRSRQMMVKVVFGYVIFGSLIFLLSEEALSMVNHFRRFPETVHVGNFAMGVVYFLLAIVPAFVLVYSVLVNRRWRKIVEEDSAKAGMERSAMTDLRSVYIWGGFALFTYLFVILTMYAVGLFAYGWSFDTMNPFLASGFFVLLFGISFSYFAVRISKDQERFAKYLPRLPNLLSILTGEEKSPRGFRNRLNFWGDLIGIGWGLPVIQISLLGHFQSFGLLLLPPILLAYFLFVIFFAGIPRRRYWGMIFLGVNGLFILTYDHFVYLMFSETLLPKDVGELWFNYAVSFWYLLCFTLLGVGGLWVFRKRGVRSQKE
jgi:hypothetical protein